jgi:prevent-host-death family protein
MSATAAVNAAEANRSFSALLRRVRGGDAVVITSHGRPVARIVPMGERDVVAASARRALFARLRAAPVGRARRWQRDELYEE